MNVQNTCEDFHFSELQFNSLLETSCGLACIPKCFKVCCYNQIILSFGSWTVHKFLTRIPRQGLMLPKALHVCSVPFAILFIELCIYLQEGYWSLSHFALNSRARAAQTPGSLDRVVISSLAGFVSEDIHVQLGVFAFKVFVCVPRLWNICGGQLQHF